MDIGERFPFSYTVVESLGNGHRACIYVNDHFCRDTGYRSTEVIGKNLSFLQGPNSSPESISFLREAIRKKRSCIQDVINYKKSGRPFLNRLLIIPIKSTEGTFFVSIQNDITTRKGLYYHNNDLERVTDSEIKHFVNNPLTVVINAHSMLLKKNSTVEERHRIQKHLEEAFFRINDYALNIESVSSFEQFDYLSLANE